MARIFWVICPDCGKKFYAAIDDFLGKDRELRCPFCGRRFKDHESSEIIKGA